MDNKNYITINGKPFILYSGLLEEAHKKGIQSLQVEILQLPLLDNEMTCIAKATLHSSDGGIFSDVGDASPKNISSKIIPHLIRMASTRAKARVLRDYCGIGITAFEELNSDEISNEDKPTESQIILAKKLALETNMDINFESLNKNEISSLINQMMSMKRKTNLKQVK